MKYFTLKELCRSEKADQLKLPNNPTQDVAACLEALVHKVLDPAREAFGKPIRVNSGFRSPIVNKTVKGAPTSQHVKGEAADLDTGSREGNKRLYELIRDTLPYDQLINEYNYSWVHVSFKAHGVNRKQELKIG